MGGVESLGGGMVLRSTLLGPEGSVAVVAGFLCGSWSGRCCAGWGWARSYVENYTVDASIFVVDDKLLSAIGGCLGTKSR